MNLVARVKRIEETHSPKRMRCVIVFDHAEAETRGAELRAAGDIGPNDTIIFLVTGVARPRHLSGADRPS